MLESQKELDVNDPRNEVIVKHMRDLKNDYLDKLLASDAKFQQHDAVSNRHLLLKARNNDPAYANMSIPQLNTDLINKDIKFIFKPDKGDAYEKSYLDWLEDIKREMTIAGYQEKILADKRNLKSKSSVQGDAVDTDTSLRRKKIFEKINKRVKQDKTGTSTNKQA